MVYNDAMIEGDTTKTSKEIHMINIDFKQTEAEIAEEIFFDDMMSDTDHPRFSTDTWNDLFIIYGTYENAKNHNFQI